MVMVFVMLLTVLMILVMITDSTTFLIPNKLVLAVVALYPLMLILVEGRADWYIDLLIGFGMFMVGFVLFSFRIMGGGDVKLLAACSLFVGIKSFGYFIIYVALWGGALALALLAAREFVPYIYGKLGKKPESIPRIFTGGQPAPYGLAIAASFLGLLWWSQIPGLKLH